MTAPGTRASIWWGAVTVVVAAAGLVIFTDTCRERAVPLLGRVLHEPADGADAVLLLVSSPGCADCEAGAAFYRELAAIAAASGGRLAVRALVPGKGAEALAWRQELTWTPGELDARSVGAPALPALLLLDKDRRVRRAWVGRLDRSQQREVIDAIPLICKRCVERRP